jgi:hypothetical protein|tara:strand:- start:115 stop:753 length:639 start_codon:yes stop_codon:yes gene_type:complete
MAKSKAEVARMVASSAMKKYKNYSAIQLSRELNRLMKLEKKQTMPANKIRIRVVKKLISKLDDKEISATEARKELKKKVPEKKQVSKKEFEKARKDLKDKKVSTADTKQISIRAYKELGKNRKKINEEAEKEGRPEAFVQYKRYKTGKKKGQIKYAFSTTEEQKQSRDWYENQVKMLAKKYNLRYVDQYDNWDIDFREKHGHVQANELSKWV